MQSKLQAFARFSKTSERRNEVSAERPNVAVSSARVRRDLTSDVVGAKGRG